MSHDSFPLGPLSLVVSEVAPDQPHVMSLMLRRPLELCETSPPLLLLLEGVELRYKKKMISPVAGLRAAMKRVGGEGTIRHGRPPALGVSSFPRFSSFLARKHVRLLGLLLLGRRRRNDKDRGRGRRRGRGGLLRLGRRWLGGRRGRLRGLWRLGRRSRRRGRLGLGRRGRSERRVADLAALVGTLARGSARGGEHELAKGALVCEETSSAGGESRVLVVAVGGAVGRGRDQGGKEKGGGKDEHTALKLGGLVGVGRGGRRRENGGKE